MNFKFSFNELPERDIALLRINGNLEFDDRAAFSECMASLLEKTQSKLVLDLTGILRITSVYMGTIMDYSLRAKDAGKIFSIIAADRLLNVLRQTGVDKTATLLQGKA